MENLKSSVVRAGLSKILSSVVLTQEPVGILHNDELVAVLTPHKPRQVIPALPIGAEQAKADWSNLIDAVAVRGARFVFTSKKKPGQVFLVRHKAFQSPFARQWIDHVSDWQTQHRQEATLEELMAIHASMASQLETLSANVQHSLADLHQKVHWVFASVNRNGDLLNTPEFGVSPLRKADDLGRYEAE